MRLLTLDDIYEFTETDEDPRTAAGTLLDAVEQGGLADPADAAPAFVIAGRLLADDGELTTALTLAEKGVKAAKADGVEEWGPRAFRADVLLRLGRTSDGMAELDALRPFLADDRYSVDVISAVLERHDQGELAVAWLTEALAHVLRRDTALSHLSASRSEEDVTLGLALMRERHRLRHKLGLPHDEYDETYEELAGAFVDYLAGPLVPDQPWCSEVFFGQEDYEHVRARWPEIAEEYGETWDEYRRHLEGVMAGAYGEGVTTLELVPASFDDLLAFVGSDKPLTPDVLDDYADSVVLTTAVIEWPPRRNDACWCGSGLKYKKCCLPRSRS